MTYDDIASAITNGEKIYNLPLRVTYYCRVSTDSDVQLNSLDNQLNYYQDYIKSKTAWTFVKGYVEEGVTGVRVDKRTSFKKMIDDAKLKKFDLIITKEVSRFARDLEDSIHYIRILKECGVGVFFENQNLNTFDINSELILNIMFNIAQDESKKLSSRVKFGHKQAIEKGHVLGSSNITGYKKDKCKLVIVEEEAKFVRKIYELYATGEYGFYKLAKKLADMGYLNKNGNIYDKDTLKRMISNPKYKGYYRGHIFEIMDYRTKRRRSIPKDEQIIYKCIDNSIPPIVSEELWDKANNILLSRTKSYKNNNCWSGGLKYPFSSKIYCKEHNVSFQRSHGKKKNIRPTWSCGMYLKYRLKACTSPIIPEVDLYNIISNVMNIIIPSKNNIILKMISLYNGIEQSNQYNEELRNIDQDIKKIEDKKLLMIDFIYNGDLKKEELKYQFIQLDNEKKRLLKKKKEILNQIEIYNNGQINVEKISKYIERELNGGALDDFIRNFVEEIIVSKINDERYNLRLDIFLNLEGEEHTRIKGARHINGALENEKIILKNQKITSTNKFIYNVYVTKW